MKKTLLILFFAAFAVGVNAQGKSKNKHHDDNRVVNGKSYEHDDDDDDHDRDHKDKVKHEKKNKKYYKNKNYKNGQYAHRRVNRGADRPVNGSNGNNTQNNGQVNNSNGVPNVVVRAFNQDHPNAQGVVWTTANGYWTASYVNGIFRPTATYKSNGQRVS